MMRAIKRTTLALMALGASVFAFKYVSADKDERACGLVNLFKTDYSNEVDRKVEFKYEESDVRVDFTRLRDWKRVCLIGWYNNDIVASSGQGLPQRAYWVGKSQCGYDPSKVISLLLVRPDGGALTRNLRLETRTKFEIGGGYDGATLPPGFDQCAYPRDAVARCIWIGQPGHGRCQLLFPISEGGLRWSAHRPQQ